MTFINRMLNVIIYVLSMAAITVVIHIAVGKFPLKFHFWMLGVAAGISDRYRILPCPWCYTYCCVCELFVCTAHYS